MLPGAVESVGVAVSGATSTGAVFIPPRFSVFHGTVAWSAPVASSSPAPTAWGSKLPTARALTLRFERTSSGTRAGFRSRSRAATAAACGAAAEVPQKRHLPAEGKAKKVVAPQSVATKSGFWINSGAVSFGAGEPPSTGAYSCLTGPREEYLSGADSVLKRTAPTLIAAAEPACPKIVGPTTSPPEETGYSTSSTPPPFSSRANFNRGLAVSD